MRPIVVGEGRALLLATLIGAAIVIVGNVATDILLGTPLLSDGALGSIDAPEVVLLYLVLASLPLVVLALRRNFDPILWFTATALAILFECYFVYQIWQDSLSGFEGGANIGLGLISMASPLLIIAILKLMAVARRHAGWPTERDGGADDVEITDDH